MIGLERMSPIERKEKSNLRIPLTEAEEALTRNLEVMKMEETKFHEEWTRDRELAEEMMLSIPGLLEDFVLDFITRGDGGCFVTAVLQQLRRQEVNRTFPGSLPTQFRMMRQTDLRRKIFHFLNKSGHHIVQEWRQDFSNKTGGKSWAEYWSYEHMLKASFWVDEIFIRGTAWFLNRDIVIHQDRNPTVRIISGNMENENSACPGPKLHVAYLFNRHYQSILPKEVGTQGKDISEPSASSLQTQEPSQELPKLSSQHLQTKPSQDLSRCPACKKELKSVIQHINKSITCQKKLGEEKLLELRRQADKKRKENNKYSKANHHKKKKEEDYEAFKASHNARQQKYIIKKRELDPVSVKASQNERQAKRRRRRGSSEDRLKAFLEVTLFAADFICISCHQRHFQTNVQPFSSTIVGKISQKMRLETCIEDLKVYSNIKSDGSMTQEEDADNEKKCTRYICKTCVGYLTRGKLPPSSVKNGLGLQMTDKKIVEEGIALTALEGSLVAKRIIFQNIFTLPKSLWTGLSGRQINIPITDNAINNTLELLPRTPLKAGLIAVNLKRRKEYKNNYRQQMIDPQKIFRFLDKAKFSGNPFYKDVETFESYKARCQNSDRDGYQLVFNMDVDDVDVRIEDREVEDDKMIIEDEIEGKEEDESNNIIPVEQKEEEDVIKKYQFKYDESVVMVDQYPEISVAPGEGQSPLNVLFDKNWDVQAFPHLHNADGSNGKDQDREVKLTDQRYFIQRINNKELRFSQCPAYLYAAVGYLDNQQIQRNINLVGTRGKQLHGENGQISYELNDEYRVLEGMKGYMKYWQTAKYEMLARLDNLGAFQFFFTLSCADLRWEPTFASIMRDKGYHLNCEVIKINGHWKQNISVLVKDKWKPLQQVIKEDLKESFHQLIRGNVNMATRYFNHRLKSFLANIVMHKKNPMAVKYFTYRIEFQQRGAGHAHGTLWLDLPRLERMVMVDGKLSNPNEENIAQEKPLKGLQNIFKKLRNNSQLSYKEMGCLKTFVDAFVTVTTDPQTVGEDVAEIAKQVNTHNHTRTCRKYGGSCRFKYPRFPSPETIIAGPLYETENVKKKKMKEYNRILTDVRVAMLDPEFIEEILRKVPKKSENYHENRKKRIHLLLARAEVTMAQYLEALKFSNLGYSVVLQRDVDEMYQNPFNAEWLRAWNGNMDIQVCLDFHAVITYITDYIEKPDTALQELIRDVLEKEESNTLKDKMKSVANVFLRSRQMGEAEAIYKLNPSMLLKNSNVVCQWVSLGEKKDRSSRWRKATEDDINAGVKTVYLEGHEGLFLEQQDMYSKYLRRPAALEDICLAQFAKMFKSTSGNRKDDEVDDELEDEDYIQHSEEDQISEDDRFHYIITFHDKSKKVPLKKFITLNNPQPGECPDMRKRMYPAALRFQKVREAKNPEKFMLYELMLYSPHRQEFEMDEVIEKYNEVYKERRKVDIVKSQVMECLEDVEEARYFAELVKAEVEQELNLEETANRMDPQMEQDNADCIEEKDPEDEEGNVFGNFDPDLYDFADEIPKSGLYKKIDIPDIKSLKSSSRQLDEYQKEVLNITVKYCKDLVKSQKLQNPAPIAPLLMVHGGAGAGKSTVIHTVASWAQKILQQPGDNPDCPYVIRTAFCGTAAANIEGQTLHSAFGFPFGNQFFSLSDKTRDVRRVALRNLKLVIIDEISMVKSDMLYMLDLKLQEIKEISDIPFGGVGLLVFGDMMQLKPVMGNYIFERPTNSQFRTTHDIEPRWNLFKSIILEKNHRQGKDKQYADLLNRVRVAQHTEEDIQILNSRIRKRGHDDLKNANVIIAATKKECATANMKHVARLPGKLLRLIATHFHQTRKNFKPRIDSRDSSVGSTQFVHELLLRKNAKVIVIHNIDTLDSLTNGQLGVFVDATETKEGAVDLLIVKLQNQKAGTENRKKHPNLAANFPGCVFLERVSLAYSLRKGGGDSGATATVIQFPLRLAHGVTAHKFQGQTVPAPTSVALYLDSVFDPSQAYVMLSRVQNINQVFIVDSFNPKKLYISSSAHEELKRLQKISFNANPGVWGRHSSDVFKIASLNIAGLSAHYADLLEDYKMLKADVIHLQETSLTPRSNGPFPYDIPGFAETSIISEGNGKGVATYSKHFSLNSWKNSDKTMQILKTMFVKLDTINVYRSQKGNQHELIQTLEKMIDRKKLCIIMGDFNLCGNEEKRNVVTLFLERLGFSQLMKEATHVQGRVIDHVYVNDKASVLEIERFSPYYSDHDGLLVSLDIKVKIIFFDNETS